MKKFLLSIFGVGVLGLSSMFAQQYDYVLPADIQDGNILHCFNWSINDVKNNLANIADAGFGAVQLSPQQRRNVTNSAVWSDVYRPYDFNFQATSAFGSAADLKTLCTEAAKYGIKVIVDVVANHVDKTSGYHDPWWDSNTAYVRSKGGSANINYNDRYSITHDRMGDYYELNSENADVIARAKAYVVWLRDQGVSGIRWDAAKHIGLPSEGCDFWKEMASVEGMFHYGEILGTPGPSNNTALITEYAKYMSVTDSRYSDLSAEGNGGIPMARAGEWAPIVGPGKLIYWGETHDTYSNTPDYGGWSSSVSQAVIDRAYAAVACRDGAAALYFARPNTSGYSNIKVVKGNDHYRESEAIRQVNKFRNKMNGRSEYFTASDDGMAVAVTRNNGGAVVVRKSAGAFTVANGGSLCPVGTYKDRVSGNTVTVTATTISGTADASGVVVIYNDELAAPDPNAPEQGYEETTMNVYYDNSVTAWTAGVNLHYWGNGETSWPGVKMTKVEGNTHGSDLYVANVPLSVNGVFSTGTGSPQSVNSPGVLKPNHIYKGLATTTNGNVNLEDCGVFGDEIIVYYDNSETLYNNVCCHYWGGSSTSTFPGVVMKKETGEIYSALVPAGTTGLVFAQQDKARQTVDVNDVHDGYIYKGLTTLSENKNTVAPGTAYDAGVGDITADTGAAPTVTVNADGITVSGMSASAVAVYGIDGTCRYQARGLNGELTLPLPKGVYVVSVDSVNVKIAVR